MNPDPNISALASALGRRAAGKPKTITPEESEARRKRMEHARKFRRKPPEKSSQE